MRLASHNVGIIRGNNRQVIGIKFGHGYCAEHEFGANGIKRLLGIDDLSNNTATSILEKDQKEKLLPLKIESFLNTKSEKVWLFRSEMSASLKEVEAIVKRKFSYEAKTLVAQLIEAYKTMLSAKLAPGKKRLPRLQINMSMLLCYSMYSGILSERDASPELVGYLKEAGEYDIEYKDYEILVNRFGCSLDKAQLVIDQIKSELWLHYKKVIVANEKWSDEQREHLEQEYKSSACLKALYEHLGFEVPEYIRDNYGYMCAWTGDSGFLFHSSIDSLELVYDAILEHKAFLGATPASNPFDRGSFGLMSLGSKVCGEFKDAFVSQFEGQLNDQLLMYRELKALGIHEALRKAGKRYYSLQPSRQEDGSFKFYLNPIEQSKFNYGWFTVQDLRNWIDGKGTVIKSAEDSTVS